MYDFLKGRLVSRTPTEVVIDVQGVGYRAEISLRTSERLPQPGQDVLLWVFFKMHEDRARLFGFADEAEREIFLALQSVAGVGPAHGLALLSGSDPEEIWHHIGEQDAKALARTKGIGPKIAQRVCVDLKDRAARHMVAVAAAPNQPTTSLLDDAISALLVLGYTEQQAKKAAQKAANSMGAGAPLEDLVREALRNT